MTPMLTVLMLVLAVPCFAQSNGGRGDNPPASCIAGDFFVRTGGSPAPCVCGATNTWTCVTGGGGGEGVPAGSILLIKSGTCPAGYTEDTDFNGRTVIGTLAANGNVGTTGGSDSVTPSAHAGAAVSAHAGTAVADHASHTHTYTDVIAHTHTIASQTATTGSASSWEHGAIDTSSTAAETLPSGSTGVAQGTTAGPSATLTHTVTQPSNHTVTQGTFTGNQFDNRQAGILLIPCRKT